METIIAQTGKYVLQEYADFNWQGYAGILILCCHLLYTIPNWEQFNRATVHTGLFFILNVSPFGLSI